MAGRELEAFALDGVRATVNVPLDRWTVAFDGEDGQGFALEFDALGPAGEPAARRHGRLRAAVPGARQRPGRRARAGARRDSARAGAPGATRTGIGSS